jgi:hypothetical protein
MAISSFKVSVPDDELSLLSQKLKLARVPDLPESLADDNGLTGQSIRKLVDFWLNDYDWRKEETELNKLPQFTTSIDVSDDFGPLNVHFVHSKSSKADSTPLLFFHGWPGNFAEITKGLKRLNDEGFDVVAPSLPGYGFTEYPKKRGFDLSKVAEMGTKLMIKLGYQKFVAQGGQSKGS